MNNAQSHLRGTDMKNNTSNRLVAGVVSAAAFCCGLAVASHAQSATTNAPAYTADGRLMFPAAYRKWVFLSSGLDMSYLPNAQRALSTFGNVFVNPEAYDAFIASGTWPDKTVFVLEVRRAEQNASINRNGRTQGEVVRTEVHLKDAARGGWAFFAFPNEMPATMIARTANCYSCHQEHAAVDTTFVQFYPELLAIARTKKTLTEHYLAEEAKGAQK
jgi:hypothetical protein